MTLTKFQGHHAIKTVKMSLVEPCLQSILVVNQCMDFDQLPKNIIGSKERSDKILVTLTRFSLRHTNILQCLGVPHLISKISTKDKIWLGGHSFPPIYKLSAGYWYNSFIFKILILIVGHLLNKVCCLYG